MTWYNKANFYHIYPIGLLGAPRENHGGEVTHRFPVLTEQWLPYLAEMGFDAVYIGPLFESTRHGYDTIDYKLVDRRLGDNEDFKAFVAEAHRLGIRIIVDGVFNHTGRDFFAFRDILEKKWDSPYKDWYKGIHFHDGGDGVGYDTWRGSGDLVNLNLQNPAVKNYLLEVVDFWIDAFDIDGIRLDCADVLDFGFMADLRAHTEQRRADFWLMGEVIHGDYSRWIGDGAHMLHSVTNYEIWKGLYSGHNSHNYFEIAHTIRHEFDPQWGMCKGTTLYTFADNHDVPRIISNLENPKNLIPVYALVYFLPGIPSVYYGSEFGIEGRKEDGDDALRPAVDLEMIRSNNAHAEVTAWIKYLNWVRRDHAEACSRGEYRELLLTNRQYAFSRSTGEDAVVIAVNNDEQPATVTIPVPFTERSYVDQVEEETFVPEGGRITVEIPADSARILVRTLE